jgi:hypothetical protein
MYYLFYLVLASSAMAEFFTTSYKGTGLPILPGPVKFLPEMLSAAYATFVVVAGLRQKFSSVPVKYLLVSGMIVVIIVCGVLVNDVAPGPVLAGMRYYLRALPFLFFPAVMKLQDWQLRRYLNFILALCFFQVPLSIYQRYHLETHGLSTGDGVMGTLMDSGGLSLFLICVMCVLSAAVVRGLLGRTAFLAIFVILVVPISINETKVTAFLLPPALLATFLVASEPGRRVRVFLSGLAVIAIGGAVFVPLYNYLNKLNTPAEEQFTIDQVFTDKFLSGYLESHSSVGRAEKGHVGRVDALVVPLKILSADPIKFAFGLGIGNVGNSSLGAAFTGKYQKAYGPFVEGFSSGTFLLEVGVVGFMLILLLHFMVLQDALFVARHDKELTGVIAAGWVGVSIVVIPGMFYTSIHVVEAFSYCYWFFSGLIVTRRLALSVQKSREVREVAQAKRVRTSHPLSGPDAAS